MIESRQRGTPVAEIAATFGITKQAVYDRIKRYERLEAERVRRDRVKFERERNSWLAAEERRKRWVRLRRETDTLVRVAWFMLGPGGAMFDDFRKRQA
jgi:transposase